jgi:uncharacterized protein YaaR (DUF327 family)
VKINPGWQPAPKNVNRSDNLPPPQMRERSFADVMHQQDEKVTTEQLMRMAEQIKLQGDRLGKAMTVRGLRLYKQMVKQFLDETARRGVRLKETKGWDRRGRTRRYKLLEEVDKHLLEMADELLETEQGRLEILHRIGEIRGLLIHILF